jgi:hypothetical protein
MTTKLSGADSWRAPHSTRLRLVVLAVILLIFGIVGPRFALAQVVRPNFGGDPAFPDCGLPPVNMPVREHSVSLAASTTPWRCVPPYETPAYVPPADDSVALGTLIEAAGIDFASSVGRSESLSTAGIAAGNYCGETGKTILVIRDTLTSSGGKPPHAFLSESLMQLQGPTPHVIAGLSAASSSNPRERWRALASGNLDASQSYDHIVLVRHVETTKNPDLVVIQVPTVGLTSLPAHMPAMEAEIKVPSLPTHCGTPTVLASARIGDTSNSDWVGAVVGSFDSTGKKRIALLRNEHPNLVLVEMDQGAGHTYNLKVVHTQDLDANSPQPFKWTALAAGDIRHEGVDELVAVRGVGDNHSATVMAFRWNGSSFIPTASSTIGNDGNSNWVAAAIGDFNADGRVALVLVKNEHSAFTVLDLPAGSAVFNVVKTSDLDTVPGQPWFGLAAADWLGGDQGADELIAVRSVGSPYRTSLFVYGDPFHLVARNSALEGTKAQYDQLSPDSQGPLIGGQQVGLTNFDRLKQIMRNTHTNTFIWQLASNFDYTNLVTFLNATKDFGVDGKQVRVWVNLIDPDDVKPSDAKHNMPFIGSLPEATPIILWSALDYFSADPTEVAKARDFSAWSQVLGRLAQDFPHLVGVGIDDFIEHLNYGGSGGNFGPDIIARMEANLRSQAPWMSLIPTTYHDLADYHTAKKPWADIGLTLDSQLFYFRDQKQFDVEGTTPCSSSQCLMPDGKTHPAPWGCLAGPVAGHITNGPAPCADATLPNALGEFADMAKLLPAGRKMLGGVYFEGHSDLGTPSAKYDYELTKMILSQPNFAGAVVYTLRIPTGPHESETCIDNPTSYENPWDKYCTVWKVFGDNP